MTHYYLPISAFVFPEVAAAEAISPTAGDIAGVFVGRSSYPTNTTGMIPINPIEAALVLYSAPVTWCYRDGAVMDYPLVIELPKAWIDDNAMSELKLPSLPKGILAWAYSKTIFFGQEEPMRYLFRTEVDKSQQLNRLLPFKEIKSLGRINTCCDSFERTGLSISELPDEIADEIRQSVSVLEFDSSQLQDDLVNETRCGACLGHAIAVARSRSSVPVRIEDSPRLLSDSDMIASAKRIADEIQNKIKQLTRVLFDGTGCEYDLDSTCLKPVFKFKGRECQRLWPSLDPIVKRCVDFIARYPRSDWNWFGDEERFVFMRELWNRILQPMIMEKSEQSLDIVRDEVFQICRHFKNPNEVAFSFDGVRSPLLQALYFALDCPRETEKLELYLRTARRPEFCLAIFGALRGYAYFSRTLLPGNSNAKLPQKGSNVPEDSRPQKPPLNNKPDAQPEAQQVSENFKTKVLKFFDGPEFTIRGEKKNAGKKDHLRTLLINVFEKIGCNPPADKFVDVLGTLKDGWNPNNQPWKQMRDRFAPEFSKPKKGGARKKSSRDKGALLPGLQEVCDSPMPSGDSLLAFNDWIDECLPLIGSAKSQSCFRDDVEYFIEHWEINPEPRYADSAKDKSNSAVLLRMKDFLERQRDTTNPKQAWKRALYAEIPIDAIVTKLKEKYGC